jgi:hypothetical protein
MVFSVFLNSHNLSHSRQIFNVYIQQTNILNAEGAMPTACARVRLSIL